MATELYQQLPTAQHAVIQASAGTGKTHTIEHLVLRLLTEKPEGEKDFLSLEQILIVTFTEKAAGELRDRIRSQIQRKIKGLLNEQKDNDSSNSSLIEHLHSCLNQFEHASISTIHAFCKRMLEEYPIQTQQPLAVEMSPEEAIATEVVHAKIRSFWKIEENKNAFFPPTDTSSISLPKSGSGWIQRLSNIILRYSPENGDTLEPSPKSDDSRQKLVFDLAKNLKSLSEFLGERSLREEDHPFLQGYSQLRKTLKVNGNFLNSKHSTVLIPLLSALEHCREVGFEPDHLPTALETFWKSTRSEVKDQKTFRYVIENNKFSEAEILSHWEKNSGLDVSSILKLADVCLSLTHQWWQAAVYAPQHKIIYQLVTECKNAMEPQKQQKGVMTYSDMISRVNRALDTPHSDLLNLLQSRYRYGMIDEFQDTNSHQWNLFEKIFVGPRSQPGVLYLIGDPKQSIYSFQGSDLGVYQKACNTLEPDLKKHFTMDTNYRSTPELIEAYNRIFSHPAWFGKASKYLPEYRQVKAPSPNEANDLKHTHTTAPIVLVDLSEIETAPDKKKHWAEWIAGEIQDAVLNKQSYAFEDVGILVQTNKEAEPICHALAQRGIPFIRYKESGLFKTEENLHLTTVLEALLQSGDSALFKKALLTAYFDFSPQDFFEDSSQRGFPEATLFETWREWINIRAWPRFFNSLNHDTGFLYRLHFYPDGDRKVNIIRQLNTYVIQCAVEENLSLTEVIRRLKALYRGEINTEDELDRLTKESDRTAVEVLTIHASKGLDFPVVFLAGGGSRGNTKHDFLTLPKKEGGREFWIDTQNVQAKKEMSRERMEENKRLFYVAMTRAKFKMYCPLFHGNSQSSGKGLTPSEFFLSPSLWSAYRDQKENNLFKLVRCTPDSTTKEGLTHEHPKQNSDKQNLEKKSNLLTLSTLLEKVDQQNSLVGYPEKELLKVEYRRREQTSYSAIAHQNPMNYTLEGRQNREDGKGEEEDIENPSLENAVSSEYNLPYKIPKGAGTGTALHEILENISFEAVGNSKTPEQLLQQEECRTLIVDCLHQQGVGSSWSDEAARMVWHTLHTQIPDPARQGETFPLHTLSEKKAEMEFHFTFDKHGRLFPKDSVAGYVLGYIDLIFEHKGYYYIADWKSNSLPAYDGESIWRNMEQEQYTTQSLLYCVAVHRWLQNILPRYQFEKNFGGIFYLYLRGIQKGTAQGINSYRPSLEEMEQTFPAEVQKLFQTSKLKSVSRE